MQDDELDYYEQRAEQEIELARRASDSRAVQAHYHLTNIYLDRIHGDEPVRGEDPGKGSDELRR